MITESETTSTLMMTYFLSDSADEKVKILDMLEQFHTDDLKKVFSAFDGKKVIVKTFDTLVFLFIKNIFFP
jgi:hypothetical protein